MRLALALVGALLLAGCADPRGPPDGTLVGQAVVQQYAESARVRATTFVVGAPYSDDAWRAHAEETTGVVDGRLTLTWPDGRTQTLEGLAFSRGPDVFFEAPIPHTGFASCALDAIVRNASGEERITFPCGIQQEHFVGLGDLALAGGRGSIDVRVWRAEPPRFADWGNGTIQHAPEEMEPLTDVVFTWWSFDIGGGRTVEGTAPPARPEPTVYRFEFDAEGRLTVGIGAFRFHATLADGRQITHEDADIRLVKP